eukprot:GFUD01067019.1.p1 GENE.GFUD01067019.1~~GFUD01067019.1.p1  ORF type:complete len:337 (+),score=85.03 GFUD01067019.1:33-1013(+)
MSKLGRVQSKNLFTNLRLEGVYDEEVAADIPDAAGMENAVKELMTVKDDGTAVASFVRKMMDAVFPGLNKLPYFQEKIEACYQEKINVPSIEENDLEIPIYVHRPKRLKGDKNAAIIYIHGGGVIAGTAEMFAGHCSRIAEVSGVVVFNVDYRLAPEAKCPKNVEDVYSALMYVVKNSEELKIDSSKIAIMGESGGGNLTCALSVMLAQKNQSHLVKVSIPTIPMLDDYAFGDTAAMTKEERDTAMLMRLTWNALAADLKAQSQEPLLFPSKASKEILEMFPPTVMFEVEFDMFITEATRFASKLRAAGRLLDMVHCKKFVFFNTL